MKEQLIKRPCPWCKNEFYCRPKSKKKYCDGYCKGMHYAHLYPEKRSISNKKWRESHYELKAEIMKKWRLTHMELIRKTRKRYRNDNPKKTKIRHMTEWAIASGKIQKHPCDICGSEKSEVHHKTYDDPFNVLWLCRRHHVDIHKELSNII
jgi:hypothetical protein